jgi:hypothetical protein
MRAKMLSVAALSFVVMLAATACIGIDEKSGEAKVEKIKKSTATVKVKAKTNGEFSHNIIRTTGIVYSAKKNNLAYEYNDGSKYGIVEAVDTDGPRAMFPKALVKKNNKKTSLGNNKAFSRKIKLTKLIAGTKYYYRAYVKGRYYTDKKNKNTAYNYSYFNVKSFKTKGIAPKVSAPTNLRATSTPNYSILVEWSGGGRLDGYQLYKFSQESYQYELVDEFKKSKTQYEDYGVYDGATATYKVRAYRNDHGLTRYSGFSAPVTVTADWWQGA